MARRIQKTARRHRALSIIATLAIVLGGTVGMVTAVGAEETPTPTDETVVQDPTTTTAAAPDETTTTAAGPEVTTTTAAAAVQSQSDDISTQNHTTFPTYEECFPSGSTNPWESDSRSDRAAVNDGECTDGNIGAGGAAPSFQLDDCTARFPNATTFYNSVDSTGTGNADLTGAITAHPGGGTQLNVTPQPGVTIEGVFVKAGSGYNTYIGNEPNMIGPLVGAWDPSDNNPSPNFGNISHYVVCYSGSAIETTDLTVLKTQSGYSEGDTFTVDVDCSDDSFDTTITFEVDANGDANPDPAGSNVISDIPDGVTCDVTETDDGNPDPENCDVTTTVNGQEGTSIEDVDPFETDTVTFDNQLVCDEEEFGSLDVDKVVQGPAPGGTTFTVEVDCDDGTSHDRTVALNNELVFDTSGVNQGPGTLPITGIPVGTQCTVTEPDDGGATSVSISPNNGVVTIVADTESTVTVTNTFIEVGGDITVRLDVDKSVIGNIPPANGAQFVVNVTCTGAVSVNQNLTFTYPNGLGVQSVTAQIPSNGSITCTVTETDPGGVILEGYKINGGATQDGAPTIVLNLGNPDDAVTVVNDPSNAVEVGGISVLPFTGSSIEAILKTGAWLLVIGGVALLLVRRRRSARARLEA